MIRSPLFWLVVVSLVVMATLPLWVSAYVIGVLTMAYYTGVFAMAWDLLFGFANEVNFGPTFLIGLGGYCAGILNTHGVPVWVCLAAGSLAAVIGGFILAVPALRVSGPYFGLCTLVAVLVLQQLIIIFSDVSGGEIGLSVPGYISADFNVRYWIAFGFMTISGIILYTLSRSPIGLILQASGQDAVQAGALGFNVTKHKLAAFGVSAFFSGLSGAMLTFDQGTASIGALVAIPLAVQIIIAAVMGGRRTIIGAAIGAIFLIGAVEVLRPMGELANFVVSAAALVFILFLPNGIVGLVSRRGAGA